MTITYALIQMVEKAAGKTGKARVTELIVSGGACTGCIYEKGGAIFKEFGLVIFASGGFSSDFTNNSLFAQYRPVLLHLPTTKCERCTGDAIGNVLFSTYAQTFFGQKSCDKFGQPLEQVITLRGALMVS